METIGGKYDLYLMYEKPQSEFVESGNGNLYLYKSGNDFCYKLENEIHVIKDKNTLKLLQKLKNKDFTNKKCDKKDIRDAVHIDISKNGHTLGKGFKNITVGQDAFEENEVKDQEQRLENAVKHFFKMEEKPDLLNPSASVLVAHGGLNRDMLLAFKKNLEEQGIPCDIPSERPKKVGFGDYFVLYLLRDIETHKIAAVHYGGQFNRHGISRSVLPVNEADLEEEEDIQPGNETPPPKPG